MVSGNRCGFHKITQKICVTSSSCPLPMAARVSAKRRGFREYRLAFAPIFIIGVPRSGTTLLRVLLDSHSEIAGLPETPWLLGAYGSEISLKAMLSGLIDGPYGAVRNVT